MSQPVTYVDSVNVVISWKLCMMESLLRTTNRKSRGLSKSGIFDRDVPDSKFYYPAGTGTG